VTDHSGESQRVVDVMRVHGYFEVFDLAVEDESHNYAANGLLCHDKAPPPDLSSGADRCSDDEGFFP
jgi:hypothetical protein